MAYCPGQVATECAVVTVETTWSGVFAVPRRADPVLPFAKCSRTLWPVGILERAVKSIRSSIARFAKCSRTLDRSRQPSPLREPGQAVKKVTAASTRAGSFAGHSSSCLRMLRWVRPTPRAYPLLRNRTFSPLGGLSPFPENPAPAQERKRAFRTASATAKYRSKRSLEDPFLARSAVRSRTRQSTALWGRSRSSAAHEALLGVRWPFLAPAGLYRSRRP